MIYIIKKSKRTKKVQRLQFTESKAKEFLYLLDNKDFYINEYIVLSADRYVEIERLKEFFADAFFLKVDFLEYGGLQINEKLPKHQRLRKTGASISSINNFVAKIENEIPDAIVTIDFKNDDFDIIITYFSMIQVMQVKLQCSYDLEIMFSETKTEDKTEKGEQEQKARKIVNRLFRKQRHYYRKKGKYE